MVSGRTVAGGQRDPLLSALPEATTNGTAGQGLNREISVRRRLGRKVSRVVRVAAVGHILVAVEPRPARPHAKRTPMTRAPSGGIRDEADVNDNYDK